MARTRKISRNPTGKNYYLLDANFLANKFIPPAQVTDVKERERIQRSLDWWAEVDAQIHAGKAMVYVPDLCIAEAYKVLAKKYYEDRYFPTPLDHKLARDRLSTFLRVSPKTLKASKRNIKVHDISTSRDIIVSVDRFFEIFHKHKLNASVVDLIILSTAKYLIDFFSIDPTHLFIVTLDNALWSGSKKIQDVPSAFNPNKPSELAAKVFIP